MKHLKKRPGNSYERLFARCMSAGASVVLVILLMILTPAGFLHTCAAGTGNGVRYTYDSSLNPYFEAMVVELYTNGTYTVPTADPALKTDLEDKFRYYFLGDMYWPSVHLDLPGTVTHIVQVPLQDIQREVTGHMAAKQIIDAFANMCEGMTDLEKVTFFHDYLCGYLAYDYEGSARQKAGGSSAIRDVYRTLVNRIAVCDGYARTFYALCGAAGVPVRFVTTGEHAWNEVQLNGAWKKVDVTWDSCGWGHTYFLVEP